METFLTAATLVLGLVSLWAGLRHLKFSSFSATLLSIVELVGVVIAVVTLGWLGIALLVAINIVAALIWSVALAAKKESLLVGGAVESGTDVKELEALWQWMRHENAFATIRPWSERGSSSCFAFGREAQKRFAQCRFRLLISK